MKKLFLALAVASVSVIPSSATPSYSACNATGHIGEIFWFNNGEFRFKMYDLPGFGNQTFTVRSSNSGIGTEGIKMMHSQFLTALTTGKEVWVGTRDANTSTGGCQESWDALYITIYQN